MNKEKRISIILCVIALLSIVFAVFVIHTRLNAYRKAKVDVAEYQQKLLEDVMSSKANASNLNSVPADMQTNLTGCDRKRVKKDDSTLDYILQSALTWSDEKSYDAGRELLMEKLNLSEDSSLMIDFYPSKYVYDEAGNAYNRWEDFWAENEYNMAYKGLQSHVVGIKDGVYSYVTFVNVSSTMHFDPDEAEDFDTSSLGKCLFTYETTEDGKFQNVNAYILS